MKRARPQQKKKAKEKQGKTTTAKKKTTTSKTSRKKGRPPVARILAVAIGPVPAGQIASYYTRTIASVADLDGCRPYIFGMVDYLSKQNRDLGSDYVIDYQQCLEGGADFTLKANTKLILCMSTPLGRAADNAGLNSFIVVVSSDNTGWGPTVCGMNAHRTDNPIAYYNQFNGELHGGTITLLHRVGNAVSDACRAAIDHPPRNVGVAPVDAPFGTDLTQNIITRINAVNTAGLLVLPVDAFFGFAKTIDTAAANKGLEVFWPTADYPAQGGPHHYASSQKQCGKKLGEHVYFILDNNALPHTRWKNC